MNNIERDELLVRLERRVEWLEEIYSQGPAPPPETEDADVRKPEGSQPGQEGQLLD